MRTLTDRPRRRAPRGAAACEEPPRLWGDEPVTAPAAVVAPAAPAPTASPVSPPGPTTPAGVTLDDLVSEGWAGLAAAGSIACPICAGAMSPRWSAGAGVVGGRCGDCGTTLE
jgi:hypothetical protein